LKDRAPRTPSERIEKGLELVRNAKTVGDLLKGLTEVFKGLGDYMKGIREYPNAKEPSKENKEEERNTKGEQVESRENTEEDDRRNVLRNEMKEKDMSASELKEAKQEELKDGDKKIDTRIDKLESEIDALDQENDEAKKQVRDIEQRLAADDVPEEEGFDLKNQLEDLKTDIKGRDEKIERREEQRKQSLEEKGNNDESLKKDIEELDKMLKELKEKVDTIRETFDKLEQAGSLDANELAIVKGILVAGNEKTMEVDFTLTADAVGALDTVLRSAKMAEADIGVQGNNVVDPVKFMEEFSTMLDKYNKTKPDLNQDAGTDPRRVENIV
jgi:chromosome segregation ATPase